MSFLSFSKVILSGSHTTLPRIWQIILPPCEPDSMTLEKDKKDIAVDTKYSKFH